MAQSWGPTRPGRTASPLCHRAGMPAMRHRVMKSRANTPQSPEGLGALVGDAVQLEVGGLIAVVHLSGDVVVDGLRLFRRVGAPLGQPGRQRPQVGVKTMWGGCSSRSKSGCASSREGHGSRVLRPEEVTVGDGELPHAVCFPPHGALRCILRRGPLPGVQSSNSILLCWGQAAGRGSHACTSWPATGTSARMLAFRVMRAVREPSCSIRPARHPAPRCPPPRGQAPVPPSGRCAGTQELPGVPAAPRPPSASRCACRPAGRRTAPR